MLRNLKNAKQRMRRSSFLVGLLCLCALPMTSVRAGEAITLYTGAKGGTFFDYGEALAKFVASQTNLVVTVRASAGSYENIKALDAGEADIALVAMGPGFEAWNGSGTWTKGQVMRGMRALVPMYETPFHLGVRGDSGVTSVAQLDGRRVGVGPEGGANDAIFRAIAGDLKIMPSIAYGTPSAHAKALIGAELEGFFFGAGVPIPAYADVAEAGKLRLLPLDGAAGESLRRHFPYLAAGSIPAGSYRGQDKPVATVSLWNFVLARPGVSDSAAYALVEALMRDPAKTTAIQVAASGTVIGNTDKNTFMPFHPGALRYYAAKGATVSVR